ncbi:MAG: ABC transporter permease [Bacteroidetes bacterium]|nr:ABC transporter permease [Bacteroidota bacterium]
MFYHYIKSFIKSVKKNQFYYALNLIGFSSGFLVLTMIFTFVYQETSFDQFHDHKANIYRIHCGGYGVTPTCFGDKLKDQVSQIENIIRFRLGELIFIDGNRKLDIGKTYYTDPEIFQVFSFKLLSGDAAHVLSTPYSIVISKSVAKKLFGDEIPIGKLIKDKDGIAYTVTGVMDDIPFQSHIQANAFISIETLRQTEGESAFGCGTWSMLTYVYLSEQANWVEAESSINEVLKEVRMGPEDDKLPLELQPLDEIYFDFENNKYDGSPHGNLQMVLLYAAISLLILFIIIINYINLSTAISVNKVKEIAIRKIHGAKQSQIVKQILVESTGMAILSFFMAIFLIELAFPQLCSLLNLQFPESFNRLSWYAIYFIGFAIIGALSGLVPGIFLSKIKETTALKNKTILNSRGIQRKALLIFQLVIVAGLLNSAFIINSQIQYILEKDLGFDYENVISLKLNEELVEKKDLLKQSLLENPQISHVSFSNSLIVDGFAKSMLGKKGKEKLSYKVSVDPDYIPLYDIDMKLGRNFSLNYSTDSTHACIVNEAACGVFELESPINEKLGDNTIIGVVKDFNITSLHNQIEPLVIFFSEKGGNIVQIKLTGRVQGEVLKYIQSKCESISQDYDFDYKIVENEIQKLYKSEMDLKSSFRFYSVIAFIIALLGLFGLALFTIKKKTREISVRKLLGAKLTDTFKLLTKEQTWIVILANMAAIPVSYLAMGNWLINFEYRVDIEYLIFLKTFVITLIATLLAVSFLIFKAHHVNLVVTLKDE